MFEPIINIQTTIFKLENMSKQLTNTSKFISLVLRHKPEEIGLILDENGWADVTELIQKTNAKGIKLDDETLQQIVDTNDKKRFSFSQDKTKIRANQGHSIEVDVELKQIQPPDVLYHGTAERFLDDIMQKGLNKMSRLHVHLTANQATAINVGQRYGKPVLLTIQAAAMHTDGHKFYLSENQVWLVEHVPVKYLLLS